MYNISIINCFLKDNLSKIKLSGEQTGSTLLLHICSFLKNPLLVYPYNALRTCTS